MGLSPILPFATHLQYLRYSLGKKLISSIMLLFKIYSTIYRESSLEVYKTKWTLKIGWMADYGPTPWPLHPILRCVLRRNPPYIDLIVFDFIRSWIEFTIFHIRDDNASITALWLFYIYSNYECIFPGLVGFQISMVKYVSNNTRLLIHKLSLFYRRVCVETSSNYRECVCLFRRLAFTHFVK